MGKRDVSIRISAEDLASGVVSQVRSRFVELTGAFVSGQLIVDGLGAAFRGLSTMVRQSAQAAMEAEKIDAQLQRALLSVGVVRRSATDQLGEYAGELARTTIHEDDAVKSAMTLLATIGRLEGEGLRKATKSTLDLASATGKDLNDAAMAVAKAAVGNEKALGQMGIKLDETVPKGERFEQMLKAINDRMGGASETELDTTYGRTVKMTEALGEFSEAVGRVVLQETGVSGFFAAWAENIKNVADEIDRVRSEGLTLDAMLGDVRGRANPSLGVSLAFSEWTAQWKAQLPTVETVLASIYDTGDRAGMKIEDVAKQVQTALDELGERTPQSAARALEYLLDLLERIDAKAEQVQKRAGKPGAPPPGKPASPDSGPSVESLGPDQWVFSPAGPDRFANANVTFGEGAPFEIKPWEFPIEDLAFMEQYQDHLDKINRSWDAQRDKVADIAGAVQGALASGIYQALTMTASLGDRLQAIWSSVLQTVLRIISEIIAAKIVSSFGFNTGGVVHAAGGMTVPYSYAVAGMRDASVDMVPAMLTPGEQVLSPAAAERYRASLGIGGGSGPTVAVALLNERREARRIVRHINEKVMRRGGRLVATEVRGRR